MSDPNVTVTPAVPVLDAGAQPKPAAAAAAAPPAATPPAGDPENPQWLGARLERERAKLLKDLGLENLEEGKKAIGELNAKREAEKTAVQKATELDASLKQTKAEKEAMAEALGGYAKTQLAALTEAQRKAVTDIAGDDATKQLKAIEALSPTWKAPAAPVTDTKATDAKPTDTALPANAPKDAGGDNKSPPDPKAIHAELKKTNPFIAARYAQANGLHDT